ncbi:hypothetical protein BJ165DRAFT_1534099 [Panaeolus papilionaceus]|nr:hypothetical protein BJ165DRAFT_1534099 [Panaeolus papilionaceus]
MSTITQRFRRFKITGPLSVEPVTPEEVKGCDIFVHILMGPTGSGKSAFIQAFSPDHDLSISKDTLESVTQRVNCYRIVGLSNKEDNDYILMDSPGFLDTKLSESRITKMIATKLHGLRQAAAAIVVIAFYFQPITDIRMGASKRDAIQLLKAFTGAFNAMGVTVITTMWNQVSTPKQIEDANRRFSDLEGGIYAGSDKLGIQVTKFEFSTESALSNVDGPYGGWWHTLNSFKDTDPRYQSIIRNNLLDRITNIQEKLDILAEQKQTAITPGREDPCLLEVTLEEEKSVLASLQSFLDDLIVTDPIGLSALQSLLDARYETDPSACASPWPYATISSSDIASTPDPHATTSTSLHPPSLPPSPFPSHMHASLSTRIKQVVSPVKKLFKKK